VTETESELFGCAATVVPRPGKPVASILVPIDPEDILRRPVGDPDGGVVKAAR